MTHRAKNPPSGLDISRVSLADIMALRRALFNIRYAEWKERRKEAPDSQIPHNPGTSSGIESNLLYKDSGL